MTAIPPDFELDMGEPKTSSKCREAQRPAPKRKASHFEYAFGQWFTTPSESEFVLA